MKISARPGSTRPAMAFPLIRARMPSTDPLRRPCGCTIDPVVFGHWDPVTGERCGRRIPARGPLEQLEEAPPRMLLPRLGGYLRSTE